MPPTSVSIPLWCDCDRSWVRWDELYVLRFQSHYGAIATFLGPTDCLHGASFNPTMVRLRPGCRSDYPGRRKWFQSHYGAIATLLHLGAQVFRCRFNPTMVRLRLCGQASCELRSDKFQSHYGAIATCPLKDKEESVVLPFQSHYGAIATLCPRNGT